MLQNRQVDITFIYRMN